MAPIVIFSYLTLFAVQNRVSVFWETALFVFYRQKPENSTFVIEKGWSFFVLTWNVFKISKNADTVLNFRYLAIKLPNFKLVDEKLPELELRVSRSFNIKIVPRKFWRPLKPTSGEILLFQNLIYMRYYNLFFAILKLYLWSIHMANNLILVISFGLKLNSNLRNPLFCYLFETEYSSPLSRYCKS